MHSWKISRKIFKKSCNSWTKNFKRTIPRWRKRKMQSSKRLFSNREVVSSTTWMRLRNYLSSLFSLKKRRISASSNSMMISPEWLKKLELRDSKCLPAWVALTIERLKQNQQPLVKLTLLRPIVTSQTIFTTWSQSTADTGSASMNFWRNWEPSTREDGSLRTNTLLWRETWALSASLRPTSQSRVTQ